MHAVHATLVVCVDCQDVHLPDHCPLYAAQESVNYMGKFPNSNNNPYSNTYNPGWRNHPNFSWSQGQQLNQNNAGGVKPTNPPGFHPNS